jgi:hypothetical protein
MSHKVSYYWFRRTQYIPELGFFYKNREDCGVVSESEELVVWQNNCSTMLHFQKQCGAAQPLLNTGRLHIAPLLHFFFNIIIIRFN